MAAPSTILKLKKLIPSPFLVSGVIYPAIDPVEVVQIPNENPLMILTIIKNNNEDSTKS